MAYTIQSGDTLSKLAGQYGSTVADIQKLNPQITDINKIYAGQNLNLPPTSAPVIPQTIKPEVLSNQGTFNIPPPPVANPQVDAASLRAQENAMREAQAKADVERERRQKEAYISSVEDRITQFGRKGAATTAAETSQYQALGLGEAPTRRLAELNTLIGTSLADVEAQAKGELGQGRPLPIALGREAAIKAAGYAGILRLQAEREALAGNIDLARKLASDSVDREFAPIEAEINAKLQTLELNKDFFSTAEKRLVEVQKQGLEAEKAKIDEKKQVKNKILDLAVEYPDSKISPDDDFSVALSKASKSPLYRASVQKAIADAGESADTGYVDANNINVPAQLRNETVLTALLGNKKIAAGTRTQIANQLGVIKAVKSLAEARQTSGFKGISPLNTILNFKVPIIGAGIPFREAAKSKEAVENAGYIEAINLKVQQWASGASLTQAQTEQVSRFTPKVNDTDSAIRTKLNNLYNFMNEQASSQLQSEGKTFIPVKTNLFELFDLMKEASPEQLKQLKDQGLL